MKRIYWIALALLISSSIGGFAFARTLQKGGAESRSTVELDNSGNPLYPCDHISAISTTGNAKLISGSTGQKIVICFRHMGPLAAAESAQFVEGTGSTCGTNTVGMEGGATAALGPSYAANGGAIDGNGRGYILWQNTAGDDLCVFKSGSGQLSGWVTWTYSNAVLFFTPITTTTTTTSTTTTT